MSELNIICPFCKTEYTFPKFPPVCPKCGNPMIISVTKTKQDNIEHKKSK